MLRLFENDNYQEEFNAKEINNNPNPSIKETSSVKGFAMFFNMEQFKNAPDVSEQAKMVGKGEGDIQVFKKDGIPQAFMWKAEEKKWEYVGEVVDPNAGGGGAGGMAPATK